MSTKPTEPEPSEWLRLLTGNRLLFEGALRFLAFAILVELAGQVVQ
jgi:hypothetical protein